MGMSTQVVGIRPADEKHLQMKAIWTACKEAGVEPPEEVYSFFEDEEPDDAGVVVELGDDCTEKYKAEGSEGIEVDLESLPKDIKIIRFTNSW